MIKYVTLALLSLSASISMTGQEADSALSLKEERAIKYRGVITNRFGSNWEVGFGLGTTIYFGDHDGMMRMIDRLSPSAGLNFGKWFTPGIGLRIGAIGGELYGLSGWTGHVLSGSGTPLNVGNYQGFIVNPILTAGKVTGGKVYPHAPAGHYALYETKQRFINVHGDVLLNLSNMLLGYDHYRTYSFIPFASFGFGFSLNRAVNGFKSHLPNLGLGLLNRFRLSNALDLNVEFRATYTSDYFDQEYVPTNTSTSGSVASLGRWGEGMFSASIGLSYKFTKTPWQRNEPKIVEVIKESIVPVETSKDFYTELQERLKDESFRKELEQALGRNVTPQTVTVRPLLITFRINRWDLSNKDRVNLGFLADALKANPDMKFKVIGYADAGTGTPSRNAFLAKVRANVIYNCLTQEFGVPEGQLVLDPQGGVANMHYDDPRCSRAVLLKVNK